MATGMNRFDWIQPVCGRGESYPPPDTDAELDAAERLLGSPLPAGYRAFARRFGLGGRLDTLPELFPLMPAATKQDRHWSDSVIDATEFWRSPETVTNDLTAEFLRQAIVFGIDEGEYTFLFHAGEVTDAAGNEYRVYQIPRHEVPERLCESFEEWLLWVRKEYNPANWDEDGEPSAKSGNSADRQVSYFLCPR